MNDDDFDAMLSAPLSSVADAGFSARVMRQVVVAQDRREIIEWLGVSVAACIFIAALPLTALVGAVEYVTLNVGNSLPVAMTVMALVLTLNFARFAAD